MFQLNKIDFSKIKLSKNSILVAVAILGVIVTVVLVFSNNIGSSVGNIAKNSVDYINKSVLQQGQTATLVSFSEESGVVKLNIKIGDNSYSSYVTKDGKLFFPEALDIGSKKDSQTGQNQNDQQTAQKTKQTCDSLTKTDKPLLEAYIVSRCPFGLQMQRMMADAIKNAPSMSEYIKVRYIGAVANGTITAMHGDAEAQENLRQICIRDEQASKYWDYVSCQMKSGDTAGCQTSTGVNATKLDGCIKDKNRGLAYAQEDFDLSSKYNISGSPTLILNGQPASEFDFGGRSSEAIKSMLSCSSKTKPDFSSTKLNEEQAATSFSLTYAGSAKPASGNSGSNGANCAPAQ